MANTRAPLPVVLFWKAHRWIYKASGGRIGENIGNIRNLLLTTTGRRSGLPRDIAIYFFEIDGKIVIIASNLGRAQHPAWYLNLKADPNVIVRIGTEVRQMTAREAEGDEREHLWQEVVKREKAYTQYKSNAGGRRIPVVVLE